MQSSGEKADMKSSHKGKKDRPIRPVFVLCFAQPSPEVKAEFSLKFLLEKDDFAVFDLFSIDFFADCFYFGFCDSDLIFELDHSSFGFTFGF